MRLCLILSLFITACSAQQMHYTGKQRNLSSNGVEDNSSCTNLSNDTRKLILQLATPEYFQKTRYRKNPRFGRNIEKEADCSSFVHEVYVRSGLPFAYRSSRDLKDAPEFQIIPEETALPGDLLVFHGHVGIIADDGKIISATLNRKKKKNREISSVTGVSAIRKIDRKFFKGNRTALRYKCVPTNALASILQ